MQRVARRELSLSRDATDVSSFGCPAVPAVKLARPVGAAATICREWTATSRSRPKIRAPAAGARLAHLGRMSKQTDSRAHGGRAKQTVLVIGGHGGMSDRYRDIVEKHGLELRHYEKRVPHGARDGGATVGLVVVMVTMVSHALREQAVNLAGNDASVVYLRSPSVSALRSAVEQWAA